MLKYKGQAVHDAACRCCRVPLADVARAVDPTGTGGIRRAMSAEFTMRFNKVRKMVRDAVVDADMLGLRAGMSSAMMVAQATAGGASRIETFQRFIDAVLLTTVLENRGDYLKPYIERAYNKGWQFASTEAPEAGTVWSMLNDKSNKIDTVTKLAFVEMQGVCEAVSQQAVRAVAKGLMSNTHPNKLVRGVYTALERIGIVRAKTVVEYVTVYAFKEATLDAYQAAQITEVGLIPESKATIKARDSIQDAPQRQKRQRRGFGSGSRNTGEAPSRRTVQRIRKQEREVVEALGERVNVVTAGDDDVCPVCETIADRGPYKINKARTLIPAHPRCRCLFKPVRKTRSRDDDQDQQHSTSAAGGNA